MSIIPKDRKWTQTNTGDVGGVLSHSWGVDLNENKGKVQVSNPLKNVFDEVDDTDLQNPVAKFVEYNSKIFAIANKVFKVTSTTGTDITLTANWSQDAVSGTPSPGATVTDAVVFDSLLLVQDGDDIKSFNGTSWASWWKTTLAQSALATGQKFILKVGPDGNLYITDGGNKVYRVTTASTVTKTGQGTLDFSSTTQILNCATTTSSRIWYGTEDSAGENAVIIEWDMGPQSISANKIHEMGVKRVLCMATWNDTPIAILSDGSIKYHNGVSFVDWKGAQLPRTNNQYHNSIIHKNGWAIIDNLPHFLINPTVDIDETSIVEDTSNYWNYPAGVYCLDPELGLYCRYALIGSTKAQRQVSSLGALFARSHKNTKFFASYDFYNSSLSAKAVIACEDKNNTIDVKGWLGFQPVDSYDEVIKKIDLLHKRLGTGDAINVYVRRFDTESILATGYWYSTTQFNTTDTITGIDEDWFVFSKTVDNWSSTVQSYDDSTTSTVIFKDANTGVAQNDSAVLEFINFKKIASITNTTKEFDVATLTDTTKSRGVWILLELKQSAGNKIELDYIITGT